MCGMVLADFTLGDGVSSSIKHLGLAYLVQGLNLGNDGILRWLRAEFGVSWFVLSVAWFCYLLHKGSKIYLCLRGTARLFPVKNLESLG